MESIDTEKWSSQRIWQMIKQTVQPLIIQQCIVHKSLKLKFLKLKRMTTGKRVLRFGNIWEIRIGVVNKLIQPNYRKPGERNPTYL